MSNFRERMRELRLTEKQLAARIYKEGQESKEGAKNPYSVGLDTRSYCTWQAGVSDR
jgi:hypothetical protein